MPTCVQYWTDKTRTSKAWCALEPGQAPSPKADRDPTACGYVIMLRIGCEEREPTCVECQKMLGLA